MKKIFILMMSLIVSTAVFAAGTGMTGNDKVTKSKGVTQTQKTGKVFSVTKTKVTSKSNKQPGIKSVTKVKVKQ